MAVTAPSKPLAFIAYAAPDWNDAQRAAWEAAKALYAAKDAAFHAWKLSSTPGSFGPRLSDVVYLQSWQTWHEFERQVVAIGLFEEGEA